MTNILEDRDKISKESISMKKFVESKIQTKFGIFIFRVYQDVQGKETVVVYTQNIGNTDPVLVRLHSECMTGDVFHSQRCDCGDQLESALHQIQKSGGAVIYLRQEGRGIGLYNKIRAYQLIAEGYDTYAANVELGFQPDARSYEMAKTVLDDLKIKNIILLTNNPNKILGLKELGLNVVGTQSLVVGINPINQKYINTKKEKFNHKI